MNDDALEIAAPAELGDRKARTGIPVRRAKRAPDIARANSSHIRVSSHRRRFKGRPGDELMFFNVDEHDRPDARTLHAGKPPKNGRKMTAIAMAAGESAIETNVVVGSGPSIPARASL